MRVTGKLLRQTESGKEFACREADSSDMPDDAVLLETVDTEYWYPVDYVRNQVTEGKLEVVRDLHNKQYKSSKRRIVHNSLKD